MKSKKFIKEKERLIKIIKENPGVFSMADLDHRVYICVATIRKIIDENDLWPMIKHRNQYGRKKKKKQISEFFQYNKLDDIY